MSMRQLARALWRDTEGFLVTAELIILVTVLVLGLFVGLNMLQSAAVSELTDVGDSLQSLDQSFQFPGLRSLCVETESASAQTAGSAFTDSGPSRVSRNAGESAVVPRDL